MPIITLFNLLVNDVQGDVGVADDGGDLTLKVGVRPEGGAVSSNTCTRVCTGVHVFLLTISYFINHSRRFLVTMHFL